jgi:DNA-binding GntR family transcriptional regulator
MSSEAIGSWAETPEQSKVDRAYDMIRSRILNGSYAPGKRLILGTLGTELGVSSVPVREAVRRLEAESLVSFTRNVGAAVRALDLDEYRWALQTLAITEGAATGLAASLLTPDALADARDLNDRMRTGLENFDPELHSDLNQRFHQVLSAPCPNPELVELVQHGWTRMSTLRSSVFAFIPDRASDSVIEHDEILAAIENSAPAERIESLTRQHRLTTLRGIVELYSEHV